MQQNFEPINFNMESTSVWSFKERGTWATHTGDYRGNCPPQVPRNLILKYTNATLNRQNLKAVMMILNLRLLVLIVIILILVVV